MKNLRPLASLARQMLLMQNHHSVIRTPTNQDFGNIHCTAVLEYVENRHRVRGYGVRRGRVGSAWAKHDRMLC